MNFIRNSLIWQLLCFGPNMDTWSSWNWLSRLYTYLNVINEVGYLDSLLQWNMIYINNKIGYLILLCPILRSNFLSFISVIQFLDFFWGKFYYYSVLLFLYQFSAQIYCIKFHPWFCFTLSVEYVHKAKIILVFARYHVSSDLFFWIPFVGHFNSLWINIKSRHNFVCVP